MPNEIKRVINTFLLSLLFMLPMNAQEQAIMIGVGRSSQLDTYLSPERYTGTEMRIIHNNIITHKGMDFHHEWTQQGSFSKTEPRSENAKMLAGEYMLKFALYRTWFTDYNLLVSLGGAAEAFLGGIYNTRNGNNPAQLHTGLNIAPTAKIDYLIELWGRSFWLTYKCSVPLIGTQFSPAYGQSYYEIFSRGNYDNNICLTHPFNAPSFTHQLTIDIPLGNNDSAIRVGYFGDIRQSELNNLKQNNITRGIVIGYVY